MIPFIKNAISTTIRSNGYTPMLHNIDTRKYGGQIIREQLCDNFFIRYNIYIYVYGYRFC